MTQLISKEASKTLWDYIHNGGWQLRINVLSKKLPLFTVTFISSISHKYPIICFDICNIYWHEPDIWNPAWKLLLQRPFSQSKLAIIYLKLWTNKLTGTKQLASSQQKNIIAGSTERAILRILQLVSYFLPSDVTMAEHIPTLLH